MKKRIRIGSFALGAVLAAIAATGCGKETRVNAAGAGTAPEVTSPDPNVFEVEHPERFPLVSAAAQPIADEVAVNGVVSPDVTRTVPVNSLAGGRVIELGARLGDDVRKGQLLLKINSPDLAMASSDYRKAQADESLARKTLTRAQLLLSHGATAEKDVQQAEDTLRKAEVDTASAAERIRLLGGDINQLVPVIEVRAPISGTVVEQNITGNAAVKSLDNSPNLFTVADLSRVWILCDVYEDNLSRVRLGDFAEVRLNAYPDKLLRGRISNIGKLLDPATRTTKVRLELDNAQHILRPGMFATVKFVSQGTQQRLVLASNAILRLHDKDWVFRYEGGNRFRTVQIQAGNILDRGSQEVLGGITPSDRVAGNALQISAEKSE